MDITAAAVQLATAIAGGVGGFAATIQTIKKNITTLERKIKHLTEEVVLLTDVDKWKQSVIQGLRLEWEQLKSEIEKRSYDRQSNPIGFEDFKRRLDDLERQRFVTQADFSEFTREEGRQWNEINRRLGEISGEQRRSR